MAERVAREGRQTVDELVRTFGVSAETVRRDLTLLAADGRVRKIHGGALGPRLRIDASFEVRVGEEMNAKIAVAERLRSLIEPGETLFMGTGSTTLRAAEMLADHVDLTIITNSAAICESMSRPGAGNVYLVGGLYRRENAQTVGPLALDQISRFRADRAILTTSALDESGAMDSNFDAAQVARAMQSQARETVMIATASKLNRQAAYPICPLSEIQMLILDKAPDGMLTRALDTAGVSVHVASTDGTPDRIDE